MLPRAWVLSTCLLACGIGSARAEVKVNSPALAVRTTGGSVVAVSVTGEGFGARPDGGALMVDAIAHGVRLRETIGATDSRVVVWKDVHVVVLLPQAFERVRVRVVTRLGSGRRVTSDEWVHDSFDTSAAAGPYGPPTSAAIDAAGRVWVNPEFKSNNYFFDPAEQRVRPAFYPRAPSPAPFQMCLPHCGASHDAQTGEAVAIDDRGRVWMPESGPATAAGRPRNHGRVVMYDPAAATVRLYNLPGDDNGVMGVAWDAPRGLLWLAQTNDTRRGSQGSLLAFDPERVPFETFAWDVATEPGSAVGAFDFPVTATCQREGGPGACSNAAHRPCTDDEDCVLADLFCAAGEDDGCYREYPLGIFQPGHVTVHPDGRVWFAEFSVGLGSSLGRLDPATGAVELFPLAQAPFAPASFPISLLHLRLRGVWDVKVERRGGIVATEFGSNRLVRFPAQRMGDTRACRALSAVGVSPADCTSAYDSATGAFVLGDARCTNPCLEDRVVPGTWAADATHPPLTHLAMGSLTDVAPDQDGTLWFAQGYVDRRGRVYLWPPLLALQQTSFSRNSPSLWYDGIGGVVLDARTGEVWGVDYRGRQLHRLRRGR